MTHLSCVVRGQRLYHVQFFSDNALTHWIGPTSMVPFEGLDKLKEYLVDLKAKVGGKPCWGGPTALDLSRSEDSHSFPMVCYMSSCFACFGETWAKF